MIKRLRKKFITVTMCSVVAVLVLLITAINIISFVNVNSEADAKISAIALNGGVFPDLNRFNEKPTDNNRFGNDFSPEAPFDTRYFTVLVSNSGSVISIDTGRIAAVDTDDAAEFALKLMISGKTKGFHEGYKYQAVSTISGTMYIFLDVSREMSTFYSFLFASITVSTLGILLVFLLVLFFSKIAIRPFIENYEKQKRFITDAGHEIKTPLTIIDAGADVIEMENGENEWTRSIKHQVKRLSELTEKLIFLAKMDEECRALNITEFSLTDIAKEAAESFFAISEARGKQLFAHIEDNVNYKGDKEAIQQLFSILIDNALKYSDENGQIHIYLRSLGKNCEISIYNTVDDIEKGRHDEMFERFYRTDSSRNSKTGGHGIGLSSAQAIVTAHKGKISAFSEDGKSITFSAVL